MSLSVFRLLGLALAVTQVQLATPAAPALRIGAQPRSWLQPGRVRPYSIAKSSVLTIRGGASRVPRIDEEEPDDDDDDAIDAELNGTPFGISGLALPPVVTDTWQGTPPVTRTFLTSSLLLTLMSSIFNQNNFPQLLEMSVPDVLQKLQIWRPITAFLYLGPLGLGYLLTLQFLWTYMSQVEKLHIDEPEKFLAMTLFGAAGLLLGFGVLGIPAQGLGHNLSSFFVYIWARMFEGAEVNLMNVITVKAEMLPWIFCLQTLLAEQALPVADLLGILIGHLYLYAEDTRWEVLQQLTSQIKILLSSARRQIS